MIAGILLAAGESTRFGRNKLLYEIEGKPLIYYSLRNCVDSLLHRIYIVLGRERRFFEEIINKFFCGEEKIKILLNRKPERGMISSLKVGIRALNEEYKAMMVILADMPFVTQSIINTLIDVFEREDKIVIPECNGKLYHPRIIPRRFFRDFLQLEDRERGRKVIERYKEEVIRVKVGNESNYLDIDTPEDLNWAM